MVCESCEARLSKVIVPDKWKDGAKNTVTSGGTVAGKTNKALGKLKAHDAYIPKEQICRICKTKTQFGYNFCNNCAHKKGLCTMCGKKVIDTSKHVMSLK
jgi:cysteine-rich PDZ-binding protein